MHLIPVSQEDSWVVPSDLWLPASRWPRSKLCSFLRSHNVIAVSTVLAGTCCRSPLGKGPPPSLRRAVDRPKDSLKWTLFFTNLNLAQHFFMILVDSYICSLPRRHFLSEEARRQWRNRVTRDSWSLPQIPPCFFPLLHCLPLRFLQIKKLLELWRCDDEEKGVLNPSA